MENSNLEACNISENIADLFCKKKLLGACLLSSAMLSTLTKDDVVEGYLIFDQHKLYFRHYWTVVENTTYDISFRVRQRLFQSSSISRLSVIAPSNDYTYLSLENEPQLMELEAGYRDYKEKPNKYLKKAPADLSQFFDYTKGILKTNIVC
mgnify:CR=1 FL=1